MATGPEKDEGRSGITLKGYSKVVHVRSAEESEHTLVYPLSTKKARAIS